MSDSIPMPSAPDDVEGWLAYHAAAPDLDNPPPMPPPVGATPDVEPVPYEGPFPAPPAHLDPPMGMAHIANRPDYVEWAQPIYDYLEAEKAWKNADPIVDVQPLTAAEILEIGMAKAREEEAAAALIVPDQAQS